MKATDGTRDSIFCTVILLAGGLTGCSAGQGAAKSGDAAVAQTPAAQENVVWASGKLLPVQWAALSPVAVGTVKAIHVAEGEQVEAGKLLMEIDSGILQSQVDVASATVAEAEAAGGLAAGRPRHRGLAAAQAT